MRPADFVEGGSLSFLIRIGGHEILTFGSMNYIERELDGLRPDVVFVGAGASRNELYDYAGRLMRVLGRPPVVLPTHWDDFYLPYGESQAPALKRLERFIAEVNEASPTTRVIVPKYFEPVILDSQPKR